jgi:hypothetical protein
MFSWRNARLAAGSLCLFYWHTAPVREALQSRKCLFFSYLERISQFHGKRGGGVRGGVRTGHIPDRLGRVARVFRMSASLLYSHCAPGEGNSRQSAGLVGEGLGVNPESILVISAFTRADLELGRLAMPIFPQRAREDGQFIDVRGSGSPAEIACWGPGPGLYDRDGPLRLGERRASTTLV